MKRILTLLTVLVMLSGCGPSEEEIKAEKKAERDRRYNEAMEGLQDNLKELGIEETDEERLQRTVDDINRKLD